jgi:hypothetical protein
MSVEPVLCVMRFFMWEWCVRVHIEITVSFLLRW